MITIRFEKVNFSILTQLKKLDRIVEKVKHKKGEIHGQ